MERKIILINGIKRVGKSTLADMLSQFIRNSFIYHLADHLRVQVQVSYGYYDFNPHMMDKIKDDPRPEFGGAKFRELCFSMAESNMKVLHGKSFYSEILCRKILHETPENGTIIIPDLGFVSEVPSFINYFGIDNLKFFRLIRPGVENHGDTRKYLSWNDIASYDEPPTQFQIGPHRFPEGIPEQPIHDIYNYEGRQFEAVKEILVACEDFLLGDPEEYQSVSKL